MNNKSRAHFSGRSHGGDIIAHTLIEHGVETIFTLCGGHISGYFPKSKTVAKNGKPVLINALVGKTSFRKGSIAL